MELEIKSLHETGTKKKLLGKALLKKKKDLWELHRRVTMNWMVIIELKYSYQNEK